MRATAAACLDLVRTTAEAKGLALSFAITPATPQKLVTDPTRLRQVLLNLLGNAVKFTSRGGVKMQLSVAAPGVPQLHNHRALGLADVDCVTGYVTVPEGIASHSAHVT